MLRLRNMAREERHKIVIDTDCGIDDALAIMLALNSKDIAEILAITCCFGNTTLDNACENVKRVLTLCDSKDVSNICRSVLKLLCYFEKCYF